VDLLSSRFVPVYFLILSLQLLTTTPQCIRVFAIAAAARISANPITTWKNFKKPGFWDPAKPSTYQKGSVPAKITWDDQFVGEVARTFKACKVFCWLPFFWLCYSQIDGNLGTVAAGMTLNGTPNDLIQNLDPITIIVLIPIFDKLVYPGLRRMGINFTPIKRIYTGFLVAALAMLYAAILQKFIYEKSPCHDNLPSECVGADGFPNPAPINVWVVSGPYILVGTAEIFASITSLEYAFTKAPKQMKSFVSAFAQFQIAVSAALNFALVQVNVENRFTWLFGSFAVTAVVGGTLFYLTFLKLDRDEAALNAIGTGDRAGFKDEHKVSEGDHA
jgi:POT family proton-dependent oligopeptide transporter